MIGVIDYGAGNLKSVANALDRLGRNYRICSEMKHLADVDSLVLPGVGQFASAMRQLSANGLIDGLRDWGGEGRPIVGICLGLQILFATSDEAPGVPGLGLIPGRIVRLDAVKVPHMGWNRLRVVRETEWLTEAEMQHFYFAHGYAAEPESSEHVSAVTDIDGKDIPAAIECGAIRAVQFHPEKSAEAGAAVLERMLSC